MEWRFPGISTFSVTSVVAIPKGLLGETWRKQVSSTLRRLEGDAALSNGKWEMDASEIELLEAEYEAVDDSVLVESYDRNRLGPEYCPEGDQQLRR